MPDRRQFLRTSALAITAGACARVPLLAQGAPAPATGFRELRRGVGIFTGPGGTIGWLATPEGAVAVDSQFPATARACVAGLRQRSAGGIQTLINTHHHGDHTAGNAAFPASARIVQQDACARLHRAGARNGGDGAREGLADETFDEAWSMTIGAERVSARHYGPAHTGGDAIVIFERANVVHAGDLVFNRMPPFVDRPSGASIRNWIAVLETVSREHADALFVFGHGRRDAVIGGAGDLLYFRDYLSAVLEHVRRGIAAGRSEAEITSLDALPRFPEHENVVKTYASPYPVFTLKHVLTAAWQELIANG